MANIATATIDISEEAFEIFLATRVQSCVATDCAFFDKAGDRAQCTLKHISIGANGKCNQYKYMAEGSDE